MPRRARVNNVSHLYTVDQKQAAVELALRECSAFINDPVPEGDTRKRIPAHFYAQNSRIFSRSLFLQAWSQYKDTQKYNPRSTGRQNTLTPLEEVELVAKLEKLIGEQGTICDDTIRLEAFYLVLSVDIKKEKDRVRKDGGRQPTNEELEMNKRVVGRATRIGGRDWLRGMNRPALKEGYLCVHLTIAYEHAPSSGR